MFDEPKLTKIEPIDGVDIFVDTKTGKFQATIGGDLVKRTQLADLRRLIRAHARPVTFLFVPHAISEPRLVKIIAVKEVSDSGKSGKYLNADKKTVESDSPDSWYAYGGSLFLPNPEVEQELATIRAEFAVLNNRWKEAKSKLTLITPAVLAEKQAELAQESSDTDEQN